ncbi:hypothetical protein [Actinobaculum massiliense]|uniref:hypothetical protein n=1 Tax=Actinobaculum massiliense TaxID=202789 RepID=UPI00254A5512|nr:hypothetical protein [Actinobaculum massiliense]MDK8319398.1 hypothetical protein [Actinobaculum massiliense]
MSEEVPFGDNASSTAPAARPGGYQSSGYDAAAHDGSSYSAGSYQSSGYYGPGPNGASYAGPGSSNSGYGNATPSPAGYGYSNPDYNRAAHNNTGYSNAGYSVANYNSANYQGAQYGDSAKPAKVPFLARFCAALNLLLALALGIGAGLLPAISAEIGGGAVAHETLLSTLTYTDATLPFLLALAGSACAVIGAVFGLATRGLAGRLGTLLVILGGGAGSAAIVTFIRAVPVQAALNAGASLSWGLWVMVAIVALLLILGALQMIYIGKKAQR